MRLLTDAELADVLGRQDDSLSEVEARLARALPADACAIVWEGDAQTFAFGYVSPGAEAILGYPARRWIDEPTFWADVVVHPEDREDAIAYCALATGKGADHVFEYRARAANGQLVWLRDVVKVVFGARGVPARLRGIMIDVTEQKRLAGLVDMRPVETIPSRAELLAR